MDVLIVSDEIQAQVCLQRMLGEWDCRIELATDGMQALKKVAQKKFDLVMLELFLMEEEHDLICRLKALCPSLAIITMTAYSMEGMQGVIIKENNIYYLLNPLKINVLKSLHCLLPDLMPGA